MLRLIEGINKFYLYHGDGKLTPLGKSVILDILVILVVLPNKNGSLYTLAFETLGETSI